MSVDLLDSMSPIHWTTVTASNGEILIDNRGSVGDVPPPEVTDGGSAAVSDGAEEIALFPERRGTRERSGHRRDKVLIIDGGSRAKVLPRYHGWKQLKKSPKNPKGILRTRDCDEIRCSCDVSPVSFVSVSYGEQHLETGQKSACLKPNDCADVSPPHYNSRSIVYGNQNWSMNDAKDGNHVTDDWAVQVSPMHSCFQQHRSVPVRAASTSPNRKISSLSPTSKKQKKMLAKARTGDMSCAPPSPLHLTAGSVVSRANSSEKPANCTDSNGGIFVVDVTPYEVSKSPEMATVVHAERRAEQVETDDGANSPFEGEDVAKTRRYKCAACCRSFAAFLFSTIGLTCLMVGYVALGGLVFVRLESDNEHQTADDMEEVKRDHLRQLWALTERVNVLHPENWTADADRILENYTAMVHVFVKKRGWDGNFDEENEYQWSFAGSLLYSITVITTIGYGHITPRTDWGRVVTIIYAIFGIPLSLLTITNLGSFMATAFRFIYRNICCGLCCVCCSEYDDVSTTDDDEKSPRDDDDNDDDDEKSNVETVTTGDHANVVQSEPVGKSSFALVGGRRRRRAEVNQVRRGGRRTRAGASRPERHVIPWRDRLRRALNTDDLKTVTVPIYVSLLLIIGYIALGALLFTVWEKDWDYLIGCYFCFVTLSTIGFGDYVPGTSLNAWASQEKLVLCALYLLFGLSLIAMCFDLMQEQARSHFQYLGRRLGILDKKT